MIFEGLRQLICYNFLTLSNSLLLFVVQFKRTNPIFKVGGSMAHQKPVETCAPKFHIFSDGNVINDWRLHQVKTTAVK